ncbi:MAG: CopG family transcriptional regulator, partial [Calditrichia bacterium]|nr:CopG family transcriptional regulator [Calditrichia bacterium]
PYLHQALKIKSVQNDRTMSDLVNEALKQSFAEDFEDLAAFEERKNEPDLDFEDVLKELKANGKI